VEEGGLPHSELHGPQQGVEHVVHHLHCRHCRALCRAQDRLPVTLETLYCLPGTKGRFDQPKM
jgi:hypothetical protein